MIKSTNIKIMGLAKEAARTIGGCACDTCDEAYCCLYQHEIGISEKEFDAIEHLVTQEQKDRAKVELGKVTVFGGKTVYRCPFLSEAGKCEIYEERFMICAMYTVVGNNYACSPINAHGSVPMLDLAKFVPKVMEIPDIYVRVQNLIGDSEGTDVLKEFKRRY